MLRVDRVIKRSGQEVELQLIRELNPEVKRDVNEAYRGNGLFLDSYHRVGKYKDKLGFVYYLYI